MEEKSGDETAETKRRRLAAAHDDAAAELLLAALEADEGPEGDASAEAVDNAYFEAYDELAIHALMLGDSPRVSAYAAAIRAHRPSLEGKIVLDVGAGSGILSLLAAQHGGAKKVYAVEAVPGMAAMAEQLVARNGLSHVVTVVQGRAEEIMLPEKVDVIISEWMGFYLVHESMLESVLIARDRWLAPDGIMLPSSARIWAAPVDAEAFRKEIEGYSSFHGLDFSPIGESELQRKCQEPRVEWLEPSRLLARPVLFAEFQDLRHLPVGSSAELKAALNFVALRSGYAAALALWFDVGFGSASGDQEVLLDTGPSAAATHWKQTLVYLGAFVAVEAGDTLPVQIMLKQSQSNARQYDISVET